MRSILLLIIFIGLLPYMLFKPHIGVLVFSWISYMNPHRLTWGFTYDFGFAQIVAIVTMLSWLISKEPKRIPLNGLAIIVAIFSFWVCLTTYFALQPVDAQKTWTETIKILIMSFVALGLINTRERLNALVWVIVLSVAFYGIKGGIFVIATGGNYLVFGPEKSAFEANNAMGMALAMIMPLLRYLQTQAKWAWMRWGLLAAMGLCILAILGTYSRGAVIGLCAMMVMFWLKSSRKFWIGAFATLALIMSLAIMPGKWMDRLESIQDYQSDWSAMDRIKMWRFGVNVAMERPLVGGGFEIFPNTRIYQRFGLDFCINPQRLEATADCVLKQRTSHSIYFQVLGEHGFVGFGLFMAILVLTFFYGSWIIRKSRDHDELAWASSLAAMMQASLVAFMTCGLFLNKAYFDLFWSIVVMMIVARILVGQALKELEPQAKAPYQPRWQRHSAEAGNLALPQQPGVAQRSSNGKPDRFT